VLLRSGQTSARLSFFERIGVEPVNHAQLATAVRHASRENASLR
jgi:hypothetical protein